MRRVWIGIAAAGVAVAAAFCLSLPRETRAGPEPAPPAGQDGPSCVGG